MKKYIVTADFIDKNTKEYFSVGNTYETNNDDRATELREMGYLGDEIVLENEKPKQKNEDKPKNKGKQRNESNQVQ
jgi:hypothetical protein